MSRTVNGFVGTYDSIANLTTRFPPNEYVGCSANIGTESPYAKAWCDGISWAGTNSTQREALRFIFSGTPDPDPNGGFPVSVARKATATSNDEVLAALIAANTTQAIEIEFTDHYVFSEGVIARSRVKLIGHGDTSWITFVPTQSNDTWFTWSRNSADPSQLTEEDQLPHCGYENLNLCSDRTVRANAFWFYGCDFPATDGVVFGVKGYSRRYTNTRCGTLSRTFSYYNGYTDVSDGTNNISDVWIDSFVDDWDGSNMLDIIDCQIYYPFGPGVLIDGAYANDILGYKFHALARSDTDFETNFITVFTEYNGAPAALGFDGSSNPRNEYAAMHVGSASAASVSGKLWQDSVAHYNTPLILKTDQWGQTANRNSLGEGRIIGGGGIYGAILITGAGDLQIGKVMAESAAPWAASVTIDASTDVATVSSINAASCCVGVPPTGTPCMITAISSPGGLPQTRKYYIIRTSTTTLKFATTYTNALASTAIDLTSTGTTVVVFAGGMLIASLGGASITIDEKSYLDNGRTAMFFSGTSVIRGMPRLGTTWSLGPQARQASGEQLLFDARDLNLAATGYLALTKRFGGWRASVSRILVVSRGTTSPAAAVIEMWTANGGTAIAASATLTNASSDGFTHEITVAQTGKNANALLTMYANCTTAVADGVVDIFVYGYPAD